MLCENFWWPFGVFLWEHFRPYLAPRSPIFFLLNFTRILWFFWGIVLTLFDIPKEHFWFSGDLAIVLVHWVPKWTKPITFGCVPFDLKFKILKDFPNTVPYWRLPLVRIREIEETPRNPKRGHLMDAESIRKTLKFSISIQLLYWRNLPQIIYLNKIFHLAKSWSVTHRL